MEWFRRALSALRGTQLSRGTVRCLTAVQNRTGAFFSWTYHDNTPDAVCSCSSHTQPIAAVRELPPIIWRQQPCQICQIADSDRSERRTKQSSQFQSEWTMRCFILMVCYKATRGYAGYLHYNTLKNTRATTKRVEQSWTKSNKVQYFAENSHPPESVGARQLDLDHLGPVSWV